MNLIENSQYNKDILYDDSFSFNGLKQKICFQKSIFKQNNTEQYFFKSFILEDSKFICQGYIYFYINSESKSSDFIGVYIKPQYRNSGLASLLVSIWIQFCLNNGYNFLGTNKTQRKPFLIYLLKTYGFEILNSDIYQNSKHVIHICKEKNDITKYLLFENEKERESFIKGKIAKEDNYKVIDKLEENMSLLDNVILSKKYALFDDYMADKKSTHVIKRHRQ